MPTIGLRVQQDGRLGGQVTVVGAPFAYQALDDSDGVTHDDFLTYVKMQTSQPISFPLWLMADGLLPTSVVLNLVARRGAAVHPRIKIGFYRGGMTVFHGTLFDPTASFTLTQRTFNTNPFTGAAWLPEEIIGLEACLANESGGSNDITLLSGTMQYVPRVAWTYPEPQIGIVA